MAIRRFGPPSNSADLIYNIAEVRLFEVDFIPKHIGIAKIYSGAHLGVYSPLLLTETDRDRPRSSGNNLAPIINSSGSRATERKTCFKTTHLQLAGKPALEFQLKVTSETKIALISNVLIT